MRPTRVLAALLLTTTGCGAAEQASADPDRSATPTSFAVLEEGPVRPGRYVFTIRNVCEEGDPVGCPVGTVAPPPLDLEVTVPEGWQHWWEFGLLTPEGEDPTAGPDGAALVMGWTTFQVGLNSDPCLSEGHEIPDVKVGPTVDDFVEAVQAQEALDVTEPIDVELGGFPGRYFELNGPADISGCDNWRPWDPGFYVQGPNNHWEVWVIDVDGSRVLIVTQYFPDTPGPIKSQLRKMAESIEFLP